MGHGTDKRQRRKIIAVRCLGDEFDRIAEKADKSGLAVGAFLRSAGLDNPGPRARRKVPVDRKLLLQAMGEIGRIGNNLNQIAKVLNSGGQPQPDELKEVLRQTAAIQNAIRQALGKRPEIDASEPRKPEIKKPEPKR